MMTDTKIEKRACGRRYCETDIFCTYFNTNFSTNQYCDAKMFNYTQDGIYIESKAAFKPRTYIFIRDKGMSFQTAGASLLDGFRRIAVGEVKWCKEISGKGSYKYGMGVKYCDPYV